MQFGVVVPEIRRELPAILPADGDRYGKVERVMRIRKAQKLKQDRNYRSGKLEKYKSRLSVQRRPSEDGEGMLVDTLV